MKDQSTIQAFQNEIANVDNLIKEGIETHGESSVVKLTLYKCRLTERLIELKYWIKL